MKHLTILILLIAIIPGCKEKYTPKPRGFFRIEFPEKKYRSLEEKYPYQFEIPVYSAISPDRHNPDHPNWINISVPGNKAEIHISYYSLPAEELKKRKLLGELMEETRSLAYKHTIKADAIEEQIFLNHSEQVFGTIYRIKGNAASPFQFFLTDSTHHFLRGAFYIREVPRIDSIQPVIDFFEPDIIRLMETTSWK